MSRKLRVLLLQGGVSSEHDVSLLSGKMVAAGLDKKKYALYIATIRSDGRWIFDGHRHPFLPGAAIAKIERAHFDVAFIALHGEFGEDGRLQSILETIGLPYTGSGPEASTLAMDKAVSCAIFKGAGLDIPPFIHILERSDLGLINEFSFPAIVKPCHGGSSVGMSFAKNRAAARRSVQEILRCGDSAIVQKYISGREFTCGILDDKSGQPKPLPPTEIVPVRGGLFDYETKYQPGRCQEITPPDISPRRVRALQEAALRAHKIIGCSGMSRSDFILKGGVFYILEINTIPGMTAASLLPQEARVAGISFSKMLDRIIQSAL